MLEPVLHGGLSTGTTTAVDVLGRRSAMPLGAGNVVRSTMRKRSRVVPPPVLLVRRKRRSNVPNVELFPGSDVKSRTRFGTAFADAHVSSGAILYVGLLRRGERGLDKFCGPGTPRRCPAPADVPFVSLKMKSAALLFVSLVPSNVQLVKVVIEPLFPHSSREKE